MPDEKGGNGVIVNQDIVDAIFTRHWLQFRIGPLIYVVEPHAYGVTHDGHHVLLAWHLLVGGNAPNALAGWGLHRLDEMRGVQMLVETFESTRQGYMRGDKRMRTIHAQL